MMEHHPGQAEAPAPLPGRRTFLQRVWKWTTVGVGGVAAAVVGVPLIAFLLGALKKKPAQEEWITLGPLSKFPRDETRLVTFTNPIRQPWDGKIAETGAFVRY